MEEMCVAMDDLCRQNQALEDDVFHIKQHQQGIDPADEVKMLYPQPLSNKIYGRRPFWRTLSHIR